MNILFLALEPPYPPNDGGRIRTYNILKQVSRHHSVTLLTSLKYPIDEYELDKLKQYCQEILTFSSKQIHSRRFTNKIKDFPRRHPVALKKYASIEMEVKIQELIRSAQFDVIHVDQIYMAQFAETYSSLPSVLTHHNIEVLAQRRELWGRSDHFSPRWWGYWLEYYRWLRYEIDISQKFDALINVSEEEADYFEARVPQVPVVVVPNGVDTDYFTLIKKSANPAALLYTGRMNYKPNVDAMVWFCKEILPLIHYQHPEATMTIVGRDPTQEIVALDKIPGVTVTGTVPDVRPYFSSTSIYIVPLRQGGGTRLKILEAMAMEMPIVSTRKGREGLNLNPGEDIINADTPAEFAMQVNRLIEDRHARDKLSRKARQTVVHRYDWAAIAQEQERAYETAISRHRGVGY